MLRARGGLAAGVLVVFGLAARLAAARAPFFTPDEALHVEIASAPTALEVYRLSLNNAHPPLFALLLHFWKSVAAGDAALRLLPVIFGTLMLPPLFAWARRLFGVHAALIALAFAAFLPSVVLVTAELRGYALMLCMIAAALAALERALDDRSPGWMLGFGALSVLAVSSHYAAIRFAAAAFVYSAARLASSKPPRSLVVAWLGAQGALAALGLVFYRTHLSRLSGGALEAEARSTWLAETYLDAAGLSPLAFLGRQTISLFHYLFESTPTGVAALALFLFALFLLSRGRRPAALLLGVPVALAAIGGLLSVYPYGGTRHSIDLVIFTAAGAAFALARLTRERDWAVYAAAALLAPAAFIAAG